MTKTAKKRRKPKTAAQVMAQLNRTARKLWDAQQRLREAEAPTLRELLRRGGNTPATLAESTGLPIGTVYEFGQAFRRKKCPRKTAKALAAVLPGVSEAALCAAWEREHAARERTRIA